MGSFRSRAGLAPCASSTSPLPVAWVGPGTGLKVERAHSYSHKALEDSVGIRAPLSPPPRRPTAGAEVLTPGLPLLLASPHSSVCQTEVGHGLPHDSPQPTAPPPTKTLSDQSLCGVDWRQETVTPPRPGQALGAARFQAERPSQALCSPGLPSRWPWDLPGRSHGPGC